MAVLEVRNLTKRWRSDRLALDDVSFDLRQGEILGLLGHNGAGKSTILGITLGMVRPDAGEVRISGHSVQQQRAKALQSIGAIYEAAHFYDYLTGWQNLKVLCSLSGWWDEAEARRVLKLVNLGERAAHKTGTYSHGMRQRLALAQALLPRPKVLLLDEPTDGARPRGHSRVPGVRHEAARRVRHDPAHQLPPARRGGADVRPLRHPQAGKKDV